MVVKIDSAKTLGTAGIGSPSRRPANASGTPSSAAKSSGSDTVNLTSSAVSLQQLSQSLSGKPSISAERIDALRSAISSGSYKINPEKIASGLLRAEHELS